MGEYADMAIENELNAYIDRRFDDEDDDNGSHIESPFITHSPKIALITKDKDYLLRSFKCNMNMVVKCIRVTDKAILFQCTDEAYTKLLNKSFWIAKSIMHISKNDLPQAQIYYLPNWATIKPIN